jgi:hypothetical protein
MMHFTPFFQFALLLVIPGALVILLAALLLTAERDGGLAPLSAALDGRRNPSRASLGATPTSRMSIIRVIDGWRGEHQ